MLTLFNRTGQTDLCLGTLSTGREFSRHLEPQIGFLANTLALRTSFSRDTSFRELLAIARTEFLESHAHQLYPLEQLADVVPRQEPGRGFLFDVLMVLHGWGDLEERVLRETGVEIALRDRRDCVSKFDMTFNFAARGGRIDAMIEFDPELYDEGSVALLWRRLAVLFSEVVSSPDRRLSEYSGRSRRSERASGAGNEISSTSRGSDDEALDLRISLDFWVKKLGACEQSDLPLALTPSGSTGDSAAGGRRRWSQVLSEEDLRFLKKACRGDAEAELVIHVTLYRVLLSFYFGPSASVVAAGGLPVGPQVPVFYTAPFDADGTLRDAIGRRGRRRWSARRTASTAGMTCTTGCAPRSRRWTSVATSSASGWCAVTGRTRTRGWSVRQPSASRCQSRSTTGRSPSLLVGLR